VAAQGSARPLHKNITQEFQATFMTGQHSL
jgi:hypothetical protein